MQNSTNEEYFFSKKKTFEQGNVYHHLGYPIGVDIEHLLKVSLRYNGSTLVFFTSEPPNWTCILSLRSNKIV